jgi:ATP-binding cassette subfamily B protein
MNKRSTNAPYRLRRELRVIARRGRKVWRLVPRRHKTALGGAALLMALVSACNTSIPLFLGQLVDHMERATRDGLNTQSLIKSATLFLGLIALAYVVREGLQVARRSLVESTCTRIEKSMTVKLVSHLMKTDLVVLTQERVGSLHGRIQRSLVGFVRFLRLSFLDFLPAVLTGGFALLAAAAKQPYVGLVMMGVIPVSLLLTVRQLISQRGVRLSLCRSREVMDGTVVEQLSGLEYVRAANTHQHEVERVARAAEKRRAKEVRHHFEMSLFGCAKALNEGFWHITVLALALFLAAHGRISFGDILTFSILFLNVMAPLNEVHRVIDEAQESAIHVGDLLDMLAEPVDASFAVSDARTPTLRDGCPVIEVRDLQVEYKLADGQRRRALDGISLSIQHGETIGVAGRSGSGKSTWLRVLMRLTHPCGGQALLGSVPSENVSRDTIAHLIGYVGQYPFIFSGSIAENIAYGCKDASDEDIRRAATMACIHDEIMAMPGGYRAVVAERGQNLSGGQKQRLALARVFLKNPPILVLDEGTSALDNISERRVQHAIAEARADRTVILVAHRLTTLVDADRILVFDNGRIVEEGTYEALVQASGVFAELVRCAGSMSAEYGSPGARTLPEVARHRPERQEAPMPALEPAPASAAG